MKDLPRYIDIVFCVIVLPVMIMMLPIERWYSHFRTYVLIAGFWLYGLYFLNRFLTVPFLFIPGKKRRAAIAVCIASLAVTYTFSAYPLYTPPPNDLDAGIVKIFPTVKHYQQAVWSLYMIVEAFSFAVSLLIQTEKQSARRQEVEFERNKAEIALYKAQIKPHFMFNTLNSLYGLFLMKSDKAVPSLERFIDMMRYTLIATRQDTVPLNDEAEHIRRYIDIQSLRLNGKTEIGVVIEIGDPSLRIPPMLLTTFVENCFKYGVSSSDESKVEIDLKENGGVLEFSTYNRIFPRKKTGEHMGIENCIRRLELSFPNRHELTIHNDNHIFRVNLKINFLK